jgi:molecular chaperone IbpA
MYDRKFIDSFFVGFDDMLNRMNGFNVKNASAVNYPPYNIRKVDENRYVIEMAVAGFGRQDIDVTIEDGTLTVSGSLKSSSENQAYLFKGIADRAFKRSFAVADTIEIRNAELLNGMLRVWLENMIPDHKKARKVEVRDAAATDKQLLTE